MSPAFVQISYLVAAVLFILGIKQLGHPRTAVRGNRLGALGMLLAIVVTLLEAGVNYGIVIAGMLVGGGFGARWALTVKMTGMPQLVALFNGWGGGASIAVAWAYSAGVFGAAPDDLSLQETVATAASAIIGAVTLTGSIVAWAKLEEKKAVQGNVLLPLHQPLNALLALLAIVLSAWIVLSPGLAPVLTFPLLVVVGSVLGVTLVLPIGGADMPVVIALLNSYSGLAATATGFVISNTVLIVAGSLVGASGIILTTIMCKAMNRSLTNVLFGRIDASAAGASDDEVYTGKIKQTSGDELAMMLDGAQRVVVVPGYGMAVAQAQHAVRDLYRLLEERGTRVEFAIHPVAGRMPGHMNVLLAEVDIPYDRLIEMESINPTFESVDMSIVIGANDVVNPSAREANSPIAGMPILDVDKSRTVVVIKRSLSPGFAGIPNPLFAGDNTLMYFGNADVAVKNLVTAIKEG